ncbi:nitroreductase family protein [Mesorhizobium sp. KR1-2]|uniref:nitroreductase family protein n=1 Tax=Mesorhizobium sp. KR1-2 TaxID=3156609 RepID=UPI0032B6107E
MRDHDSVPLPDYRELDQSEMIARASSFYEEIRRRHTVRSFSPRPVPREIIEHCIMAAGTAPSGANHQPWFFSAIGDAATKREIREKAEIEERAFYVDRKAGEAWLDALAPLGTDELKPYLEIAP